MVQHYDAWVILRHVYGLFARFHAVDSVLDDMQKQVLYYHQILSRICSETVLPSNFILSIFE